MPALIGVHLGASAMKSRVTRLLLFGWSLILLGLVAPVILPVEAFPVFGYLLTSLRSDDSGYLILAAGMLVFINSWRALPLFLGTFLIVEALVPYLNERQRPMILAYVVPIVVIPLAYTLLNRLHGLDYHFGVPAVAAIVAVVVLHRLSLHTQAVLNKAFIFSFLLYGLQWLHVAPLLSGLGFGSGSVSTDIKTSALILGIEHLLNQVAFFMTITFCAVAFIMAKLMVDHTQHLALLKRHQQQERELAERRLEAIRARSTREIQNLVHDLKSPIAGVTALISTVAHNQSQPDLRRYLKQAETALNRISAMISEMLHSDVRRVISGDEMLAYIHSHLPQQEAVHLHMPPALPPVKVNLVRMSRALANLVQNAMDAASDGSGEVTIRAGVFKDSLRIRIRDRGEGIATHSMPQVGEPGFSTKGSSGLGIPFARSIIEEEHGGTLRILSRHGLGTLVTLMLPLAHQASEELETGEMAPVIPLISADTVGSHGGERPRLLVVDDDPSILLTFQAIAVDAGWELATFLDGQQALEQWPAGMWDIAVIDYHMPRLDGLSMLRAMRRVDESTPILVMTVDDSLSVASRFLRAGANDFVLKPIKGVDLIARIRVHLKQKSVDSAPGLEAFAGVLEVKGIQSHTLELIIRTLGETREFLTANEIARRCGVAVSTAYRYLATLETHGFLEARLQYGAGRPRKTLRLRESFLSWEARTMG